MFRKLVVWIILATFTFSIICQIKPVTAYVSGSGGTHDFIFDQASTILRNDGFASIADFLNLHDPGDTGGRSYLGVMKAAGNDHDAGNDHFMDPMDHTGLYIWPGYQKSAGTLCQEIFDQAVNYWRSGDFHNAIYYLGWATDLLQNLCVPHHALPTGSDWHSEYESWVDSNKYSFQVSSGGIYSFSSFQDIEYYQTENGGPPSQAGWHYSGSNPTAYDWVDYDAHQSIKYFYMVNGQTNSDPTDANIVQAETIHPLPNNFDSNFTFVEYGMSAMQLYFDKIDMGSNGYVRIYNASDNLLASYTGIQNGLWTPHFYATGGVLKVRATTGSSAPCYGYKISQLHVHDRIEDPSTATAALLPLAQRTTAGFIKFFFDWVDALPAVSITPSSVAMDMGQSQLFTSTVSGGTSPYSYQWYLSTTILGNTIVNPGFETGNFNGWNQEGLNSASIRPDEHHSGSYSCASPFSGTYLPFKITQRLPSVLSDFVTNVGCWRKWGYSAIDWLRVNYTDGSVSSIGLGGSADWTYVTLNLMPNKTVDSLMLERTTSQGNIICVDDVEFSVNGHPVSGATGSTWSYTPDSLGSYKVYVQLTDNTGFNTNSNIANVTVNSVPSAAISPTSFVMDVGQSQLFTSTVSNGKSPYSYQWYSNDTPVSEATNPTWAFTPSSSGSYNVYLNVTDNVGFEATSNVTLVTVNPALSVSISPTSMTIDIGQSQLFTSSVTNGTSPYTYQWYLNGTSVSGATNQTWTFTPGSPASYNVYVNVTDNVGFSANSSIVTVTVNPVPSVSISPGSVVFDVGQSQLFTSTVSNGTSPYYYLWYLNGTIVPDATSATWAFNPPSAGSYTVYVNVTDSVGVQAISNTANVTVNSSVLLIHDVAVTNVTSFKAVVGLGYGLNISVTVENHGNYTETVRLTVYANGASIELQNVTLSDGDSMNVIFTWNTTGFAYGNYTISAYAWPVQDETNTADNNLTGRTVEVNIPGDVDNDGKVDILDAIKLGLAFGATPGSSNWNPNADINGDGVANILDSIILSNHFLQHYP